MKVAIVAVMLLAAVSLFGCSSDSAALAKARAEADAARAEAAAAKTELAQLQAQWARGADLLVTRIARTQRGANSLEEELAKEIITLPGVRLVEGALIDLASYPEAGIKIVHLFGLDPSSAHMAEFKLKQGRKLTNDDRHKVAVGRMLARNLGKKVGEKIEFLGEPFEIIAIYDSYDLLENNGLVIPLREMQSILGLHNKVTTLRISLQESHRHPDKVEEIRSQILALRTPAGKSYNIDVMRTR